MTHVGNADWPSQRYHQVALRESGHPPPDGHAGPAGQQASYAA
jgi:hypothetical protein